MPKCQRCKRLERRLRVLMGRELELARNSYSIQGRLTDSAWKFGDREGFDEYKRCVEALRQ